MVDSDWGAQIISSFLKLYPQISIELNCPATIDSMAEMQLDALLCLGPRPETDNVVISFGSSKMRLYGSRAYQNNKPFPSTKEELNGHDFIDFSELPWAENCPSGYQDIKMHKRFNSSIASMVTASVREGLGLAFFPEILLVDYPHKNELIPLLPQCSYDLALWVVLSRNKQATRKTKIFIQHLMQKASESAPWDY